MGGDILAHYPLEVFFNATSRLPMSSSPSSFSLGFPTLLWQIVRTQHPILTLYDQDMSFPIS
eukprot:UN01548